MSPALGSATITPISRRATWFGVVVAIRFVSFPVLFGVAFPYSLAAAELVMWMLLVAAAWSVPLRRRDQLA